MKNSQKGFLSIIVVIIIALSVAAGGYYVVNKSRSENKVAEVKKETTASTTTQTSETKPTEEAKTSVSVDVKADAKIKTPVATQKVTTSNPYQVVINNYSTCGKNDIACQCKFITSYHCDAIKSGNTSFTRFQLLVGAKVIKETQSSQPVQQSFINGGVATVGVTELVKTPQTFTLSGVTTQCLNASFIKEEGEWKIGNPEPAACSN